MKSYLLKEFIVGDILVIKGRDGRTQCCRYDGRCFVDFLSGSAYDRLSIWVYSHVMCYPHEAWKRVSVSTKDGCVSLAKLLLADRQLVDDAECDEQQLLNYAAYRVLVEACLVEEFVANGEDSIELHILKENNDILMAWRERVVPKIDREDHINEKECVAMKHTLEILQMREQFDQEKQQFQREITELRDSFAKEKASHAAEIANLQSEIDALKAKNTSDEALHTAEKAQKEQIGFENGRASVKKIYRVKIEREGRENRFVTLASVTAKDVFLKKIQVAIDMLRGDKKEKPLATVHVKECTLHHDGNLLSLE